MKLDLGCGRKKKEGFLGIDIFPYPGVDKVLDIEKGLPFKDNSIEEIYTAHFLEHIEKLKYVMKEIYRVCKPNAKVIVIVPHYSGNSAYFEEHRNFFRFDSFVVLCEDKPNVYSDGMKFKILKAQITFYKKWWLPWNYIVEPLLNLDDRLNQIYENTFLRGLFPADTVKFELEVLK